MAKRAFHKLIPTAILAGGITTYISYWIYDGYKRSTTPSNFELAVKKLGFTSYKKVNPNNDSVMASEQHEALLTQFQMAGYLHPQKLWRDINSLGIKNPIKAFEEIYPALIKSKADQVDPTTFNAKILRKNLCKGTALDEQDAMDLILYISQHAFDRNQGQERHEVVSQNWMSKYEEQYFAAAKKLCLIDRIHPEQTEYDLCWIAGGCRIAALGRIIDYNYILSKYDIKILEGTLVLAGSHELPTSAAGVNPTIRDKLIEAYKAKTNIDTLEISQPENDSKALEEGKQYLLGLAERYNITLDSLYPFIQYNTKVECPTGRNPGIIYANYYNKEEETKLTEALMCEDLLTTYNPNVTVKSALLENDQKATTITTARIGAQGFVESIKNGHYGDQKEFTVLLQTNNPFIERQTIANQREINKALKEHGLAQQGYKVQVEGVGYGCKQGIKTVHSELAAIIAEKWETAMVNNNVQQTVEATPKRLIKDLKYQTRNKDLPIPPYPDISHIDLSGDIVKDFFDEYLP